MVILSDGSDYTGVQNRLLTFDQSTNSTTVSISVLGDDIYELTESFLATLSFSGASVPRVTLSPASAGVAIIDDDGQFIDSNCN